MKKIITILLVPLFLLAGCYAAPEYGNLGWLEYTETAEYTQITIPEVELMLQEKNSFVLVYGSSTCSACIAFKDVAIEYITEMKQKLYYFPAENYSSLSNAQKTVLTNLVDITSTPSFALVKKGELVHSFTDKVSKARFKEILAGYFVTAPKILSLEQMRAKRDNNDEFLALIGRPDCGTCTLFNQEKYTKLLKDYPAKLIMFDTKAIRDAASGSGATQEAIDFYNAVRLEFKFDWTPTLIYFKNKQIIDRFQWLDNNYYQDSYLKIYYNAFEDVPAIPATHKGLEGKTYSTVDAKKTAMIKYYNKIYDDWIKQYVK